MLEELANSKTSVEDSSSSHEETERNFCSVSKGKIQTSEILIL